MNTYFAIKRADGRYMKIRQNGKTRNWVKNLKGASVGTEAQMQACLDVIQREYRRLGREADADGCQLVKVGEAASTWQAKLEAVNTKQIRTMEQNKSITLYDIADAWNGFVERNEEPDMTLINSMIEEGGFVNDSYEQYGLCHNDKERVVLLDDMTAYILDNE